MDKRVLLATVVSMGVVLLWIAFAKPQAAKPEAAPTPAQTQTATTAPTATKADRPAPTPTPTQTPTTSQSRPAPTPTPTQTPTSQIRFGKIDIYVSPWWAHVYLGEKKVADAPVKGLRLPVGHHRLKLVNPVKHRVAWLEVDVPAGKPYRVSLK